MQKALLAPALAACISLAIGSAAQAGIATGDTVKINTSTSAGAYSGVPTLFGDASHSTTTLFGPGNGGEFLMTVTGGTAENIGSKFLTFCIETNEYITNNGTYKVIINGAANKGGVGGGSPDPVSSATRYLFQQYYLGNLDNLTSAYGNGTTDPFSYNVGTEADEVQEAIWKLENEIGSTSGLASYLVTLANAATYNPLLGSVAVAQLWDSVAIVGGVAVGTGFHQDQLVFMPPPDFGQPVVPEAASVVTWCVLGMVGGGGFCWRRRQRGNS